MEKESIWRTVGGQLAGSKSQLKTGHLWPNGGWPIRPQFPPAQSRATAPVVRGGPEESVDRDCLHNQQLTHKWLTNRATNVTGGETAPFGAILHWVVQNKQTLPGCHTQLGGEIVTVETVFIFTLLKSVKIVDILITRIFPGPPHP